MRKYLLFDGFRCGTETLWGVSYLGFSYGSYLGAAYTQLFGEHADRIVLDSDIQAHRASEPLFGPLDRNIAPCAFWPTAHRQPTVAVHNAVPALIVGTSGDINAVLPMQQAMHRALTGSRMITLTDVDPRRRLATAFAELALAV